MKAKAKIQMTMWVEARLKKQLEALAKKRGCFESWIVRNALQSYLDTEDGPPESGGDGR